MSYDLVCPIKSFFKDFICNWSFRNLHHSIQEVPFLISVAIYCDKKNTNDKRRKAKDIIFRWKIDKKILLEPPLNMKKLLFKKVLLNLKEYSQNINSFEQDRELTLSFLLQNIQLYSVMLDILELSKDKSAQLSFEKQLMNLYGKSANLNN